MALGGGALALHGCRLGLGSCCGLLQLELQPILMEDGPTHLDGISPWEIAQLASGSVGHLAHEHPTATWLLWVLALDHDVPQQQWSDLVLLWLGKSGSGSGHGPTGSWLPQGGRWLLHGHGCWH